MATQDEQLIVGKIKLLEQQLNEEIAKFSSISSHHHVEVSEMQQTVIGRHRPIPSIVVRSYVEVTD